MADSKVEFLLFRRSKEVRYAEQWRMIGGKIEGSERAWQTALREVLEETGLHPARMWTIPSANAFYEWEDDRVNVCPAFAAELSGDPAVDREHDGYDWFDEAAAVDCLLWPEQQRLLRLAASMLAKGIPPELFIRIEQGLVW